MLQLAFFLQLFSSINLRLSKLNLAHVFVDIIYATCPFTLPPICFSYSKRNYQYLIIVRYKCSCTKPPLLLSRAKLGLFADSSITSSCMLLLLSISACFSSSVTFTNSLNWSFKVAIIKIS